MTKTLVKRYKMMTTYESFLEAADILIEMMFETNDIVEIRKLSARLKSLYTRYPEHYKAMREEV